MKWLLRTLAITLLLLVVAMTLARRENSGWITFSSDRDGDTQIYLMTGDGEEVRQVTHNHLCADAANWSPNGKWITFLTPCAGTFAVMSIRPSGRNQHFVSPATSFQWSPDSEHLLITRDYSGAFIVKADGSQERHLSDSHHRPKWSSDGEWVYADTSGSLERIHVSTGRTEELLTKSGDSLFTVDESPDGTQLVFLLPTEHGNELFLLSPDNPAIEAIPVDLPPAFVQYPRWSPDGTWIAFYGWDGQSNRIYRIRPDGQDLQSLPALPAEIYSLQWSPDGEWLLFGLKSHGEANIFRMRADGSIMEDLTPTSGRNTAPQYAPVSGKEWHPLGLGVVALGIFAVSFVIGRLTLFFAIPTQGLTRFGIVYNP